MYGLLHLADTTVQRVIVPKYTTGKFTIEMVMNYHVALLQLHMEVMVYGFLTTKIMIYCTGLSTYTYLGVDFTSNGAWDEHAKRVLQNGRKKISQVHSDRDIDLTARRLLLISVVRPTLEYGSEVWEGNKAQAAALESVMIGGAKRTLGCSSRTCNEAVRGDMGLDSLQGRRDKAKLKWWYKVATMPERRYPRKLFVQEWNVKPRRGRQRKHWCKVVDNLFSSLGLDKAE